MYKIILLGDSLVADYDWQSHLSSYRVQNFGVPGATSADLYPFIVLSGFLVWNFIARTIGHAFAL